jgi:hypothetical protein
MRRLRVPLLFALLGWSLCATGAAAAEPVNPASAPTPASVPASVPLPVPGPSSTPAPGASAVPTPTPTPVDRAELTARLKRVGPFRLTAKHIEFYSSRYAMEADDGVAVLLGDGTRVTGNTFYMDLRLNRFVIAGDVKLYSGTTEIDGAAFSDYLDFDRIYFLPVLTEPDRWTYAAGDYAHPLRGREMPGDAFFLPDVSGERVFLYSKRAVVDPHQSVHFWPATLNFNEALLTFPGYFLLFSPNPNFAQNSLAGAVVDGPYDFLGGAHSLSTLHVRYDAQNKLYFAIEQHQVSDNSYLVASINPLTRPLKQYNLLGYDKISPNVELQAPIQEIAFQHAFSQPLDATLYVAPRINIALPRSALQSNGVFYYDSLLAMPAPGIDGLYYYGDPTHPWIPDHPVNLSFNWVGYQNQVNKLPLYFRLRSGYGFAHDTLTPLLDLGGVKYTNVFTDTLGITLLTPSIRLARGRFGPQFDPTINASWDQQSQWSSVPHRIDTDTLTVSLSKGLDPHVSALVQYTNQNIGDHYFSGTDQTAVYPSVIGIGVNNQQYPSYKAFRGFATTRALTEQLLYVPSTKLSMSLSFREDRDFPEAVPQPVGEPQTGLSPYEATYDIRYRFNSILAIDVQRSYFFNWGGYYRWGNPNGLPSFVIQVVK